MRKLSLDEINEAHRQGAIGVVIRKNGEIYDYALNWETAEQFADDGYQVFVIQNDGEKQRQEIQSICNYRLEAAIDCFGEGYVK